MDKMESRPGKFWPFVASLTGGFLLLAGTVSAFGYLGLPLLFASEDLLGAQLGQMAAISVGLVGGTLALYHGLASLRNKPARPMRLPPAYFFAIVFALVLGLGNVFIRFSGVDLYLFPAIFFLGACLPTFAVLAWAARRLGWPVTWRQGSLALVAGSTLSIIVALALEVLLGVGIYFLLSTLAFISNSFGDISASGSQGFLERLFLSPSLLFFLLITAVQAPIPEEFAKALVPGFMGRRIRNERQAFLIGLFAGAGFAILENMLYEGLYAQWSGWSWGGVTILRGIGAVLHPLCSGIIALALYRARSRGSNWFGQLLRAYLLSVGLHTLWNGGFEGLMYVTGVDYYSDLGQSVNIYGESVAVLLVIFLVALSLALWWLLRYYVHDLAVDRMPELTPLTMTSRTLAGIALVCLVVIVPIGTVLGPAWDSIKTAVSVGLPEETKRLPASSPAEPTLTPEPSPRITATPRTMPTLRPTNPPIELDLTSLSDRQLLFTSNRKYSDDIILWNGIEFVLLTDNLVIDKHPAVSPDGRWIAFTSTRDGNEEIYVMDKEEPMPIRLTENPAKDTSPTWSPDGRFIVFQSMRDGNWELYRMDADGGNLHRLTSNPAEDMSPAWSPDAQRIAFTSKRTGNLDIFIMDAYDGSLDQLTYDSSSDSSPTWSPDGQQIAFQSDRNGSWIIMVMNIDGNDIHVLYDGPGNPMLPAWSPDGQYIAFVSYFEGNMEIAAIDLEGGEIIRITVDSATDTEPAWVP